MPSKRSKSKERERKRRARQGMTDEQKDLAREKAKIKMQKIRENKNEKEKETDRVKARQNMRIMRENQSEAEKEDSNEKSRLRMLDFLYNRETSEQKDLRLEKDKIRKEIEAGERSEDEEKEFRHTKKLSMRKSREEQTEEIKEYQKIENKHKRRIARKNLSHEKRLENNKIAKEEMKKLRKEGRLKPFEERGKQNPVELYDYRDYYESSNENAKFLHAVRPDIVKTLNETIRKEEEEKRASLERLKLGEACPGLKAHVAWIKNRKTKKIETRRIMKVKMKFSLSLKLIRKKIF